MSKIMWISSSVCLVASILGLFFWLLSGDVWEVLGGAGWRRVRILDSFRS